MIAAWQSWSDRAGSPNRQIADALGAFGTNIAQVRRTGSALFSASGGQHPACGTVLHGWIDNRDALERELGLGDCSDAELYDAAVTRWGQQADSHIVGNYAAITLSESGAVRLSRSPWQAPPLHFAADTDRAVASTLLRALFAAGVPHDFDYDRVADQLAYDFREDDLAGWYRGIKTVPLGTVITLERGGISEHRWYDVANIAPTRSVSTEEAAETAFAFLRDAARLALHDNPHSALALSGGLDSPLVAAALTDELGSDARLDTITFRPDPAWADHTPSDICGDEWSKVQQIATHNPKLHPHMADPSIGGFSYMAREMLGAMQLFAPGLANMGPFHGVYAKAKEISAKTLLTANLGNQSFSAEGRWAYAEFARQGKWIELARLLANRAGDDRSLVRKALALSVLPNLPAGLRHAMRGIVHPDRKDMTAYLSLLSPQALQSQRSRARQRDTASEWDDQVHARSRLEAAEADHRAENGEGADVTLAFEQLYGIRTRDVTAYRPLIEYCISLPTEHFAWAGTHRLLARKMAKGRLPESIRTSADHGQHNIDWHLRIGRERAQLIAACHVMRDHPVLSNLLDLDRMEHLLANWPDRQSYDIDQDWPRMLGIPRAILAAQMIGMVEGRNDI